MTELVLLHGFTGGPDSFAAVCSELPSSVRVIAPTLAGHGPHGTATLGESFVEELDRLAAELRQGGVTNAHLCGYSLGGRVAIGLLVRHPGLFSSATIVSAHPGIVTDAERRRRIESDTRHIDMLESRGLMAFIDVWERESIFATQSTLDEAALARQRELRSRHTAEGLAGSLRQLGLGRMPNFRPYLRSVSVPVTLLVGAHDPRFAALAERMGILLSRATVHRVEGAGHNLVLERPDVVRNAITAAVSVAATRTAA